MVKNSSTDLSIIVPVYNEAQSIELLHTELLNVLQNINKSFEIIFIDDGSSDESFNILKRISSRNSITRIIQFCRNYGQSAALLAGIDYSKGNIIVPMDADLQNDPKDIPRLLNELDNGWDVVSGWRKRRRDPFFTRTIPSIIANKIISFFTKLRLHDYGCTMKAYKREFLEGIELYGETHRFLPYLAWQRGAKITELEVNHRTRRFGHSKYNLLRIFKVVIDIMTIKFIGSYMTKPNYIFSGIGSILACLGILSGVVTLIEKYFYGIWVHKNPKILLAIFLFIVGIQFISLGLLAEIIIRTYYSKDNKSYLIREVINF